MKWAPPREKPSNKSAEVKSFIHRIGREELGEPKAKPGASLPRSETNRQFLPASRFILCVNFLMTEKGKNFKRKNLISFFLFQRDPAT